MAVVEIHTGIISSPKHAPLSDGALRLWLNGLCWSKEHLTDGFIPSGALRILHLRASHYLPELLRVLVSGKGPLWHEVEGGYQIHDYDQWQDTKDRVQDRRQQWRERQDRRRTKVSEQLATLRDITEGNPEQSRVTHTFSPSDGSGGGRGRGKQIPPTPKGADLFDRFWQAYPRHTGKANAEKAFAKLKADEDLLEAMLAALTWQRRQPAWTKDAGQFIPHPSTWLNHRRWEDEHPDGAPNGTLLDESPVDPKFDISKPYEPKIRPLTGGW